MKKIDFESKVSKKATIIFAASVAVFVLIGIIVSVCVGKTYYESLEAKLVGYSLTEKPGLYAKEGAFVYAADNDVDYVDANKVLHTSKGAKLKIEKVCLLDGNKLVETDGKSVLDLTDGKIYYVFCSVMSYDKVASYIVSFVKYENRTSLPDVKELIHDFSFNDYVIDNQ